MTEYNALVLVEEVFDPFPTEGDSPDDIAVAIVNAGTGALLSGPELVSAYPRTPGGMSSTFRRGDRGMFLLFAGNPDPHDIFYSLPDYLPFPITGGAVRFMDGYRPVGCSPTGDDVLLLRVSDRNLFIKFAGSEDLVQLAGPTYPLVPLNIEVCVEAVWLEPGGPALIAVVGAAGAGAGFGNRHMTMRTYAADGSVVSTVFEGVEVARDGRYQGVLGARYAAWTDSGVTHTHNLLTGQNTADVVATNNLGLRFVAGDRVVWRGDSFTNAEIRALPGQSLIREVLPWVVAADEQKGVLVVEAYRADPADPWGGDLYIETEDIDTGAVLTSALVPSSYLAVWPIAYNVPPDPPFWTGFKNTSELVGGADPAPVPLPPGAGLLTAERVPAPEGSIAEEFGGASTSNGGFGLLAPSVPLLSDPQVFLTGFYAAPAAFSPTRFFVDFDTSQSPGGVPAGEFFIEVRTTDDVFVGIIHMLQEGASPEFPLHTGAQSVEDLMVQDGQQLIIKVIEVTPL